MFLWFPHVSVSSGKHAVWIPKPQGELFIRKRKTYLYETGVDWTGQRVETSR